MIITGKASQAERTASTKVAMTLKKPEKHKESWHK